MNEDERRVTFWESQAFLRMLYYVVGFAVGFCEATFACGAGYPDYPIDDSVNFAEWSQSRPNFAAGFGPIVDDLESMNDGTAHSQTNAPHRMRDEKDVGNWVHEMTHQINSDFRGIMWTRTGVRYGCFYVLNRQAVSLPQPNVTLEQVATVIPKKFHDQFHKDYFTGPRLKYRDHVANEWIYERSLNVLDEATAASNGLWYQVSNEKVDKHREHLARRWATSNQFLLVAVKKFDPDYAQMDKLEAFVGWTNRRLLHLADCHRYLYDPPMPQPYKIW
jgi:hypothetical protein